MRLKAGIGIGGSMIVLAVAAGAVLAFIRTRR